jgi:hypothetical protein
MVFNLLEFNKRFRYYWWLTVNENQRSWGGNQRSWGGPADEIIPWQWPRAEPPEGIVIVDPKDYPKFPPLNRNCDKINIHETILAEYDSVWPREEYLEQYFQVYHSISNQIIRELVKQGSSDYFLQRFIEGIQCFYPIPLQLPPVNCTQKRRPWNRGKLYITNLRLESRRKV